MTRNSAFNVCFSLLVVQLITFLDFSCKSHFEFTIALVSSLCLTIF